MKIKIVVTLLALVLVLTSCSDTNEVKSTRGPNLPSDLHQYELNGDVPSFVGRGSITDEMATLGRVLFYDKALSINNTTSCGSCHIQSQGFGDGKAVSSGFLNQATPRHSMHLVNMFAHTSYFWDGRANRLQDQVLMPVENHIEMGLDDINLLTAKLAVIDYYEPLFEQAFGSSDVDADRISRALSAFVGSIVSYQAKFDRVKAGEDVFTSLEKFGEELFETKYVCSSCHGGSNFNSQWREISFANIGLDKEDADPGLNGLFKVPSLRNTMVSAPYMHDGRFSTMDEVIDHYSTGLKKNVNLDWRLTRFGNIGMDISGDEKEALIAFLGTLTDHDLLLDIKFSDPF